MTKPDTNQKMDRHTSHVPYSDTQKKGGAGKGNWGVPGQEGGDEVLDKKDPNYDSSGEGEGEAGK